MIYVLYIDGKLKGGIKEMVENRCSDTSHDEVWFYLYNGEVWRTYGPVDFFPLYVGGSYAIDSNYSWRV